MEFPSRSNLRKNTSTPMGSGDYQKDLLDNLKKSVNNTDLSRWRDEPDIKIKEIEKQKEFFWIRIYLLEEDNNLKVGDTVYISFRPTNERLEMIFGGYEKVGLNKDYNQEVINYVSEDDKKILCCMIDLNRVNKESDDIPTVRTFFRNSRHYVEELYFKDDIIISTKNKEYKYSSIGF